MKSVVLCFLVSILFLLSACETEIHIYDSDKIGNDLIVQNYRISANSGHCSKDENPPAMSTSASFRREKDVVYLVSPAVLIVNGQEAKPSKIFAQKHNGTTYPNGISPLFSTTFPCPQDKLTFDFTDQNDKKFVNQVDLRKAILKIPSVIQSDQQLEIEYENPSNSEILEFEVGVYDEKDSRKMFEWNGKTKVEKGLPTIDFGAKKIIIPKEVWATSKRGENSLLFKFTTKMPLKEGEKGEIEYDYAIDSKVEIK